MRRLLPPVLLLAVIVLMALTHGQIDVPVVVPAAVRPVSLGLLGLGIGVALAARAQFARARTTVHTFERPQRLVTRGLFGLSRNPMYIGLSLIVIGAGLWCGAVSSLALAALFVVVTDRYYIPFEERMMKEVFGTAFVEYTRTTRRWL